MIVTLITIHFQQKFPRGITSGKEVEREVTGYQCMAENGVVFTKTGE